MNSIRLFVVACAASIPALSSMLASAQGIPLRYGQAYSAVTSVFSLPVVIAEREGLFKKEGLDFKVVVPIPGGSDQMIAAMHKDMFDITHVATPFLVRAVLGGSDAVAITAEFNNPIYSLVARPDINNYADLKGKQLGLADEAGSITISIRKLLAMKGVRKDDFSAKVIEGTSARLACLKKAECAAVPLGQPQDLVAQSEGYRILGLSTESVPELLYTVTAVRRSWAETNKDTLVRYARAMAASFRLIRDPAKREVVVKSLASTTGVTPAIAEKVLTLYFEPEKRVLPRQGEIDMRGFNQMITLMGDAGLIKAPLPGAEKFVDLQYLRAAGVK